MKYRPRRRPAEFDAVLSAESGEYPVKLRDVTSLGVKAAGVTGYVYPEGEIHLVVRNQRLPGSIAWVNEDTVGVRFNRPLPKDLEVLMVRGTGGAGFTRAPRR